MELSWILLLVLASVSLRIGEAQVKPFFINCGSNSSINAAGKKWTGDLVTRSNFTLSTRGIIASSDEIDKGAPNRELYRTARIFNTTSAYNFSVSPGSYYLRLHFYPFSFNNFYPNESSFHVTANDLKLVSKFNVPSEILWKNAISKSNSTSLVKEYFLKINDNILELEFIPDSKSFAFVNAIEVIPVLDQLFSDSVKKVPGSSLNNPSNLMDRGIETMYRVNIGGPEIDSDQDSSLSRNWDSDERYIFAVAAASNINNSSSITYSSTNGSAIAPLLVYESARTMTNAQVSEKKINISWRFDVDPSFDYLVRLHFCEFDYDKPNQRIFKIYVNNKTAADNYDIFAHAEGMNKAYHDDFVDSVSQQTDSLWVQLGPVDSVTSGSSTDALLNGLEIFKLGHNGNLAHVLSKIDVGGQAANGNKPNSKLVVVVIVVVVAVLLTGLLAGACFIYFCKKKPINVKENDTQSKLNDRTVAITRLEKMFTLAEIKAATKSFDESLVIGTGGFGKVYKGEIGGALVAIKRAHPNSQQGLKEFETEIEMLSKLRHRHLVSMIGYCKEQSEMILVYEYMANGTLRGHLFGSELPPLTWKQRLEACIGAARGLHYLHTGADRGIIHRDVKTTNILLDEAFVAKVADFGLSKDGPELDQTHVSTAVKGSFGYLDPEYFRRQQLTQKSDVYSFGVVLFEVICARPVINPTLPRDQINLAEWALQWQRRQSLETIVDPKLEGSYSLESLRKFGEVAEKCLADEGKDRPTMGQVLWHLECVLAMMHEEVPSVGEESGKSFSLPQIKEGDEESALNS